MTAQHSGELPSATNATDADLFGLTDGQIRFFDTFGFLKLEGLVRDQVEEITSEFEAVFPQVGASHSGDKRTCIVPFVDQREKLCALLDHPGIVGAATSLMGADFNYLGSDGNYYSGDTPWHSDGYHDEGLYVKFAFYLDEVRKESGALRVIPGSHRVDMKHWAALGARQSGELWGVAGNEVPAVVLESNPGDVLVFNHNLMHAAFGGSSKRRMFTLNLSRRAESESEIADLKNFIGSNARFWIDRMHGEAMVRTATPQRQIHLQQVQDNEGHLPALAARARQEQAEPSRG